MTRNLPLRWFISAALLTPFVIFHGIVGTSALSLWFTDQFIDPDSYSRLLRVRELNDSGRWYMERFARSNAPFGEVQHSTRPFDVLLLMGAYALKPFFGFAKGLHWWAALISPLLHVAAACALAWATRALRRPGAPALAMGLFALQLGVAQYLVFGRPDHHGAIFLAFIVALGATARCLARPEQTRWAAGAGAAAGFGLWLSTELLLLLAAVLAALVLGWLRAAGRARSAEWIRAGLWHASGLLATVTVATLAEKPVGEFFIAEYDRVSVVHVALSALAVGFWPLLALLDRRREGGGDVGSRLLPALAAAVAAGGAMLLLYPKFFRGPMAEIDPRMTSMVLSDIGEMQSILEPQSVATTVLRVVLYLLPAMVGLPYLARRLAGAATTPAWNVWLLIAICLAVYIPVGSLSVRFLPFVGILLSVVLAHLLAGALRRAWRRDERIAAGAVAFIGCVIVAGTTTMAVLMARGADSHSPCLAGLRELAPHLMDADKVGGESLTILAAPDMGPELLYRTGHKVVATPSHRNPGAIDFYRVLGAQRDDDALRLIQERDVDLIVVCRRLPVNVIGADSVLYVRLLDGQAPAWLANVRLPIDVASYYRVYRVRK